MNKLILMGIASTFMIGAILTSCNSSAEKVEHAKSDVRAANKKLDEAEADYKADVESFRAETAKKIAANDKSILDYKARVEFEKKEAKAKYKETIAELEVKNNEMKQKMENYKEGSKDNWEQFKADFKTDMEAISEKFKTVILKPIN